MHVNKLILFKLLMFTSILLRSLLFSKEVLATSSTLGAQIVCDYQQFYTSTDLSFRLLGLGLGGILANSQLDPNFRNYWQSHVRNKSTNNISEVIHHYSDAANYPIALPFYFITMWLSTSSFSPAHVHGVGRWANHSLRTIIVGTPELFVLAHFLGGGRPITGHPQWHLLKYHRAVSGHAFYGAAALLNLAKQSTEPSLKFSLAVLSVLPGLARINDDKHYLSQVVLGWWLAYSATNAVWESDKVRRKSHNLALQMLPLDRGIYLGLKANF